MENKQKLLALLIAGTLAFGGLTAGCGSTPMSEQEQEQEDEDLDIKIKSKSKSLGSAAKGSVSS